MRALLTMLAVAFLASGAEAQELGIELRAGPALHHLEVRDTFWPWNSGRIEDVSVELIYTPPIDLSLLGSPRLALGGTFNTAGFENMVHANLNWHVPVFDTQVFLEGGLGGAYVTGYLHNPPSGFRRLGCHTMFYFQATVGVELPNDWNATLSEEHSSHAWLCGEDNESLNSIAVKIGHRF